MKLLGKLYNKAKNGKKGGFNTLITTVCLILIVMILIFIFRQTIATQISESITGVANEIEEISNWDAGLGGGGTPVDPTP